MAVTLINRLIGDDTFPDFCLKSVLLRRSDIMILDIVKLRVRVKIKVKDKSQKSKLDPEVGVVMGWPTHHHPPPNNFF